MKTMKYYLTIIFGLLIAVCAEASELSLRWQMPEEMKKILLEKTGAKSIHLISGVACRYTAKYEIVAIEAELNTWGDVKIGLNEGIMHVRVAFVKQDGGEVLLYSLDYRIEHVLTSKSLDLSDGFLKFK